MNTYHKKKNLFKFFKSKEFNEARMKMCALYVLISYANELHEDVDRLLQGYDGLLIGMLKHKSKLATKALDEYDKEYALHIEGGMGHLSDTTIIATTEIETAIKQNQFFLQEGYKAVARAISEQIDKTIKDPEELEKEAFCGFEIFDKESHESLKRETMRLIRSRLKDDPQVDKVMQGVELGFDTAVNYVNKVYLES